MNGLIQQIQNTYFFEKSYATALQNFAIIGATGVLSPEFFNEVRKSYSSQV
jgi:hypothetical protein